MKTESFGKLRVSQRLITSGPRQTIDALKDATYCVRCFKQPCKPLIISMYSSKSQFTSWGYTEHQILKCGLKLFKPEWGLNLFKTTIKPLKIFVVGQYL